MKLLWTQENTGFKKMEENKDKKTTLTGKLQLKKLLMQVKLNKTFLMVEVNLFPLRLRKKELSPQ